MSETDDSHELPMRAALDEAVRAGEAGEVPVGAVVVLDGVLIGRGNNRTLRDIDPSAHAEVVALRDAARTVGNHRLTGASLYTTLEPCLMCCGAAVHARVASLVHAADDPKAGALDELRRLIAGKKLNHSMDLLAGPLAAEAGQLLKDFFRVRRGS